MREAIITILFGPLAVAVVCFAFSLFYATRMFCNIRDDRKLVAYIAAPLTFLSPAFYTPAGERHFKSFQKWFQRFTVWLFVWGLLALSAAVITKVA